MQNLATFLLMPISFSGTISRGMLTLRNCYFSFFTKKPVLKIFFTEEYVKFGHFFTKGNFFFRAPFLGAALLVGNAKSVFSLKNMS